MAGRLIGEAFISLLPDATLFRTDADARIKQAMAGLQARIKIMGDTSDVDAKASALAATLKGLSDQSIKFETRDGLVDIGTLEQALAGLRERAENIPLDMNDSKGLAKLFTMMAGIDALSKQAEEMDADFNIERALAKFYTLETGVKALDDAAGGMRADFDEAAANEKLLELGAGVSHLAASLSAMRADVTDAAALAKIVTLQSQALKLAGTLKNMPITADTLPFEADMFKLAAQVQALNRLESGSGAAPSSVGLAGALASFEKMEDRLAAIDQYLQQTGDIGSRSFAALSTAIKDVNTRLAALKQNGIGQENVTEVRNLDAAIKQLSSDTGLATAEANKAYQGFGLWGRAIAAIKNTSIPLYGGALEGIAPKFLADASGLHLLVEGVVEFTAVWGPALLALSAFAALAYKTGKEVFLQFTAMNTVVDATGAKFKGLKGTLSGWEDAIQPEVLQLFGDYLTLSGNNASHFGAVMQDVGRVLDDFGAKLTLYLNSQTTSKFLDKAAGDIQGLGIAFTDIGRIIQTLLQAVPGYAQMLLKFGDAFLTVTANIVSFAEPVIAWFLKLHGAEFYLGLATTAVLTFGKALAATTIARVAGQSEEALTGFAAAAATWASDFTSDNEKVAEAAGATGSKVQKLGGIMGNIVGAVANVAIAIGSGVVALARYGSAIIALAAEEGIMAAATLVWEDSLASLTKAWAVMTAIVSPEILVLGAAAALIGGTLYYAFTHASDAAVTFNKQMQALISNSNYADIQRNIASAIADTTKQLTAFNSAYAGALEGAKTGAARGAGVWATGEQAKYLAGLKTTVTESDNYNARLSALATTYGSVSNATGIATLAGVDAGNVAKDNAKQWALDEQKIAATAAAYGFMGNQAGAAGAQLNALNIQQGTNYKALQNLIGAETAWVGLITGGDTAFTTFEQSFTELNSAMGSNAKNAATLSVSIGGLKDKFSAFGGQMQGTSQSSLALRQAFDAQLGSATTLYGSLQSLTAASGNTKTAQLELASSGKDIVAQLLPFAAGSKQATAEVSALAQLMGGPATDNFATLAKWVGNVKNAEGNLNDEQAKLTISSANLTTAAKNLGNALQTMVTQDEAAAIAKTANLAGATEGLAQAASHARDQVTQQSVTLAGEYLTALEKTGIGTSTATQYLNAYLKQLGYSGSSIAAIDGQLKDSVSQWTKYDSAITQNTSAAKNLSAATTGNKNALASLSDLIPMTTSQYNALWAAIVKEDGALVKSGYNATTAKTQFQNFATQGLGVSANAAQQLWSKFGQQNLDVLSAKAGATKNSFIQLAENGLHLTDSQSQQLWNEFAMQNLDQMASKGTSMKNAFIQLAKNGLDYTSAEANTLWNTLKNQYLDTLAHKAGETEAAFVKTAGQFNVTAGAAQQLWNKLHQIPANVNTNITETLSGSGEIKAQVTAKSLILTSAGSAPVPGVSSASALANRAAGGVISGGIHGKDSVPTMLAPGELVIPSTHAAMFNDQAKRAGIPGFAGGGVVGSPSATVANIQQGVTTAQKGQAAMTAAAMAAFVTAIKGKQNALEAAAVGSAASGNLLSIARFFLANGANAAAAAGIAADISGESGGNPESVEAGGGGGQGLIQWTGNSVGIPAGQAIITGNAARDMSVQLRGVLGYIASRGGLGRINAAGNPVLAGEAFSTMLAPASQYSDTRSALAEALFADLAVSKTTAAKMGKSSGGVIKPYSTGGTINEPVHGQGLYTGLPYSFAENGPEVVSNVGQMQARPSSMPAMTTYQGQALIGLLQTLVRQGQQFPQAVGGAIGTAGSNGVRHGYYGAQN